MPDHLATLRDVADTLARTNEYRAEVLADRRDAIRTARTAGVTWPVIAEHLGITVRAALKAAAEDALTNTLDA